MGAEIFGSTFEKDSLVFEEGQVGREMYIIQSGGVEISRKRGDKVEVLAILEKDDFFGEMSLINNEPRTATARTIQRSRLLPITKESLLERGKKDPSVFLHMLRTLISHLKTANVASRSMADKIIAESQTEEADALSGESAAPVVASIPAGSEPLEAEEAVHWDPDSLVAFNPGDIIFREGDPGDEMFIIIKGMVRICQGEGEERQELTVLMPGEFFGEMAIISAAPRSAAAIAASGTILARIKQAELHDLILAKPEIALHLTRNIIKRLREKQSVLLDPQEHLETARQLWRPVLKKKRITVAIVSLSTCAGCSSVLLDDRVLGELFKYTKLLYCPMLMDKAEIPEADVAIVDGIVRLKEDIHTLEETRAKSRYLVAWGTCATYGGIPAEANRFEPEDLIAETYGHTSDAFAYYLSGKSGVDAAATYQSHDTVALIRQAGRLSNFERVDYAIPGCPPNPALLLLLIKELMSEQPGKAKPIVCAECSRKPAKDACGPLSLSPLAGADPGICLTSLGLACMGFVTKGGCGAACASNGLPCWGCRGPSAQAMKKIAAGEYYEEVFSNGLSQRCKIDEATARERVRAFRRLGHALYGFDHETSGNMQRCR